MWKKIIQFLLSIFILSIILFYMSRLAAGDPLVSYYGDGVERMSIEEPDKAINKLGLDEPIYTQYGKWIVNAFKGDFGISYKYKQDVKIVINNVYKNTIILVGCGYVLTFIGALFLGIFSANMIYLWLDRLVIE